MEVDEGSALGAGGGMAALEERVVLLERLTRVARSVLRRGPLDETLQAVTDGAAELLGDEVIGVRLRDPRDPDHLVIVASHGVRHDDAGDHGRIRVGDGVGGLAIAEDRVVVLDPYHESDQAISHYADKRLQVAMGAPVREEDRIVGSITVGSYREDRHYSPAEQAVLAMFADHVSLALTEARRFEALQDLRRTEELFFATASHELKTPLTVVLGALRTLQRPDLPEHVRSMLTVNALQRGEQLARMIDRLLSGSRADLAAKPAPASLRALLHDAVAGFDAGRDLRVGDVPDRLVVLDGEGFTNLLGTLLENAVAHTPEGARIDVAVEASEGGVRVAVANEGTLPGDLAALFEPWVRGTRGGTAGVGLGLHIAQRLARALGGALEATQDEGVVTFTATVPCEIRVVAS